MSAKHTPGPWFILEDEFDYPGIEADGGTFSVFIFGYHEDDGGVRGKTSEEALANAHLIAAAPELLEALIELRNFYIEMTGLPPVAANAAIAKAKGERQ